MFLLFSCKKESPQNPIQADPGTDQMIKNEGGWQVIRQQLLPISGDAYVVEPNRFEYVNSSLYLQSNIVNVLQVNATDDTRYDLNGSSLSINGKDDVPILDPRFYFEGDTSNRIGLYSKVYVHKNGNTIFTFPSNLYYSLTVSNMPFIGYFYGASLYTLNLDNNVLHNYGSCSSLYTEIHFHGTMVFDKKYMEANPGKARLGYASYSNISYNGYPGHMISTYVAEDNGIVSMGDTTSAYWTKANDYKTATADNQYFYYFFGGLITNIWANSGNLVLLVTDKITGKIIKRLMFPELEFASQVCLVENGNYIALCDRMHIFKLNLGDYSLTDISPVPTASWKSTAGPYKMATDGTSLFVAMGQGAISSQTINVKSCLNIARYY